MKNNTQIVFKSGLKKQDISKLRYDLIPVELLERLAKHYTKALEKYPENNWKKATKEESKIYKEAAWRHFLAFQANLKDEDHAIATIWNIISWVWINEYKNNEIQKRK